MTEVVLSSAHLAKAYGRRRVLKDVSFEASAGSLVGIVGENGSGKSTLLRILAGFLRPSGGELRVRGSVGYCPQQSVLSEALTPRQHLEYFAAAYRLPDDTYGLELVERLNFGAYLDREVRELSGGTQQKLNLTLALMHSPSVLLLDEPYQGFDWETYLRFWSLATRLRQQGACVVVISHLVFDKSRFDVIYELHDGSLVPEPPPRGDGSPEVGA